MQRISSGNFSTLGPLMTAIEAPPAPLGTACAALVRSAAWRDSRDLASPIRKQL